MPTRAVTIFCGITEVTTLLTRQGTSNIRFLFFCEIYPIRQPLCEFPNCNPGPFLARGKQCEVVRRTLWQRLWPQYLTVHRESKDTENE